MWTPDQNFLDKDFFSITDRKKVNFSKFQLFLMVDTVVKKWKIPSTRVYCVRKWHLRNATFSSRSPNFFSKIFEKNSYRCALFSKGNTFHLGIFDVFLHLEEKSRSVIDFFRLLPLCTFYRIKSKFFFKFSYRVIFFVWSFGENLLLQKPRLLGFWSSQFVILRWRI